MIITQTPLRISFAGGGTDLPAPVAPAMRPCRLHIAAESCTTALMSVVPPTTPRPRLNALPLVA